MFVLSKLGETKAALWGETEEDRVEAEKGVDEEVIEGGSVQMLSNSKWWWWTVRVKNEKGAQTKVVKPIKGLVSKL